MLKLVEEYAQRPARDWPSSFFLSMDPVAIQSVGFDFLYEEFDEDHPTEGDLRIPRHPLAWDLPDEPERHAPLLGENTVEVLTEAGLDEAEIDRLLASGAAHQA